jgi:hypothetical protein
MHEPPRKPKSPDAKSIIRRVPARFAFTSARESRPYYNEIIQGCKRLQNLAEERLCARSSAFQFLLYCSVNHHPAFHLFQ